MEGIAACISLFLFPLLFTFKFYRMIKHTIRAFKWRQKNKTHEINQSIFKYIVKEIIGTLASIIGGLLVFMCLLIISSGYLDRTRVLYRHLYIFGSYSHKNTIILQ